MLKRDYLVKQFEEFGKVMAVLLGLKRDAKFSELEELINTTSQKYTSTEINFVETIPDELLLQTLIEDKKLSDEQLKMLGDLLFEKAEYYLKSETSSKQADQCYKKAFLLYSFLKTQATLSYSLDMHYKLEILTKMGF